MKRGVLRTDAQNKPFMISMDTILEALKTAEVSFIVEKKRVHEHLRLRKKEEV